MSQIENIPETELDPTAESRKRDHIELAFKSQVTAAALDDRFDYEPMLAAHPEPGSYPSQDFLGKKLSAPLWVSSMTGGTKEANTINRNLARACGEFGLGMGLGSCRALLYSDEFLDDFAVRSFIGPDQPLYANLGVAQLETIFAEKDWQRVVDMMGKLATDGLIIHVNPFQEWLQPEGDRFLQSPLETIQQVLDVADVPVIVKEVGQGMGPASLRALLQLPLAAIDFAASGGTNFSKLELFRASDQERMQYEAVAKVGHTATEMLRWTNELVTELGDQVQCRELIISGGVQSFLEGFYLVKNAALPAVYGQASAFLRQARGEYADLRDYVAGQIRGLELAAAYLQPRAL